MDLNKVMLIGRLAQNPELRTTPTGKSVVSVGVATGRTWTDQAGNKQEKTEFSNCVMWGKLAEIANQYLTKGRRVYIEGRLETRDWVGTDGVKRYRTEVIVDNMIMLDSPRSPTSGTPMSSSAPPLQEEGKGGVLPGASVGNEPTAPPAEEEIKVEDIPF